MTWLIYYNTTCLKSNTKQREMLINQHLLILINTTVNFQKNIYVTLVRFFYRKFEQAKFMSIIKHV